MKWYEKYGRKTSRIMIRFGKYRRILWKHEKYEEKIGWIVKWYGKYEEK